MELSHYSDQLNSVAKQALANQEKWIVDILEQIPLGIFAMNWDNEKKVFFWNRRMEELLQIPKSEALGQTAECIFKGRHDMANMLRMDVIVAKTKKMMEIPSLEIQGQARKIIVRIKKVPIVDSSSDQLIILGIVEEITKSKTSEFKLIQAHQEREELEQIINHSPVILFLFRDAKNYPIDFVSENVWRFGFHDDFFSQEDRGLVDFVGEENKSYFKEQISRFNVETPDVTFQFQVSHKKRWYETTLWPVDRQSQGACLIQGIFTDITEKKVIQDELAEAKEQADAANEAKSRFLATVTHELRTPLNGILGMTTLVLDTELKGEQKEFLGLVKYSAENLLQIINDILDFSKVEAGHLTFEWIPVCPRDLIDKSIKSLESLAKSQSIELIREIDPCLAQEYLLDPIRLTQVLNNLVGNAIKFTEKGFVKLVAMPLERAPASVWDHFDGEIPKCDDPGQLAVYFCIQDTGIGISKEKIQHIFKAFSQSDASISRKYGGTGLGLTISRMLIAKFSGDIWVESQEGKGSRFHFYVMLKKKRYIAESGLDRSRLETPETVSLVGPLRILLAEDNPVNRKVAIKHLEKLGWDVFSVANGLNALKILKERSFDAVLMDIHMPVLDGRAALTKIRRDPEFENIARQPVIAMTAISGVDEIQRLLAEGFDGFVSKPFKALDMKNAIVQAVLQKEKE